MIDENKGIQNNKNIPITNIKETTSLGTSFNNSKNSNKIIINRQKNENELVNKEYNDIHESPTNNIKINNFLPDSNPKTYHFLNVLSKPSPIIPPKNISKHKNSPFINRYKSISKINNKILRGLGLNGSFVKNVLNIN